MSWTDDLRARLEAAEAEVTKILDRPHTGGMPSQREFEYRARLGGKVEGIKLALSYVAEIPVAEPTCAGFVAYMNTAHGVRPIFHSPCGKPVHILDSVRLGVSDETGSCRSCEAPIWNSEPFCWNCGSAEIEAVTRAVG